VTVINAPPLRRMLSPGARNGYRPVSVKTTAGPVSLERPKLRGTTAAFASRLFGKHVTKTNALESLVIASFVRGLSVRDVEATLAEALGDQAAISKSTVAQVCQAIKTEYGTWARRRLDDVVLDYLFLDASFFRMHPGSPAEPILAAWGVTTAGKPVFGLLGVSVGQTRKLGAGGLGIRCCNRARRRHRRVVHRADESRATGLI
jgi:putative transposase